MRVLLFIGSFILFAFSNASSQSFNIGVRAGLNYNKFNGPVEVGESLGFNNGFHFGLSYQYNFIENFGIRAELQYTQTGGRKEYSGPSFYVLRYDTNVVFEPGFFNGVDNNGDGNVDSPGYLLEVSNAYINFPITAHIKIGKKFEILAGPYVGFLVNPTANGILRFDSENNPDDIFFQQTLSYNYYQDEPLEFRTQANFTIVYIDDEAVGVPKVAQAYYQLTEKSRSAYKVLDFGAVAGINYYFNKGFYAGARATYGFLDVSRESFDFSLREFNSNETFVTRNDKDTNLGLEFSLGFKF